MTASSGVADAGAAGTGSRRAARNSSLEEHLALVGEVAEERALGESGARGDVGHGGLLVAALGVELERGLLQAPGGVWFPTTHARDARAMTATDIMC